MGDGIAVALGVRMANVLKPHSQEWFDALELANPGQAAQTKQIISLAGKNDVCSVCGDEPAQDFCLPGREITPGIIATMKLCNDCRSIRANGGENFVPIEG